MPDAALRRMTVPEFLGWESGDDRHYELIAGMPMAMAPPDSPHRVVAGNLTGEIRAALRGRRPDCTVQPQAGIASPREADTFYEADLAVTCTGPAAAGQHNMPDPVLIVEVLSPSTERHDRTRKLRDYRLLPSVTEILLVDPGQLHCEVHRRLPDGSWRLDIVSGEEERLRLDSVGLDVPLAVIYEGVALSEP